ncbi:MULTISPECIES: hypothetical protein [Sinorhizobium]|uniref:Uncharacterized protein n=1 Tax=Sinorhizobium americanum TaxID=194963 RepID=A0A2S3YVQ0_9HYPH|nr:MULTISPECIES: hypothetical protein [Sinorhizobium]PDT39780.1 hypothetical protein CO656_19110 [Sinorhizobium sp. FG01]POH35703.1 hypothetical protein ATY31_00240 [Sinorhizobium americanum]
MASVGKIRLGPGHDDVVVIIDNGSPPLHVDLFTELADEEGIVRISFAALTQDGEGQKKADVVARLRMTKELAWALCRAIKELDKPSGGLRRP